MVTRSSLPTLLLGVGLVLVLVSTVPDPGAADGDYVHRVEPAANGTLAYGLDYDDEDVLPYDDLSARGQRVFDRARADSPYVVENESATAPEFAYTSDHVAVGQGLYPVQYEGEVYSLTTEHRSSGFNAAAWLAGLVARGLGVVLVAAGLTLAGWRRYGDD
jgi:hypothetical protein